jgi:glyoxylase-like metal-dependent hydrolase (beta-lactamase superfamily II)
MAINLFRTTSGETYCYLLPGSTGVVLIDAGPASRAAAIITDGDAFVGDLVVN